MVWLALQLSSSLDSAESELSCFFAAGKVREGVLVSVLKFEVLPRLPEELVELSLGSWVAELGDVLVDAPSSLVLAYLTLKLGESQAYLDQILSLDDMKTLLKQISGFSKSIELGHLSKS